jgi:hypothetical protein
MTTQTPKIKSEEDENGEKQKTDQECSPIYDILLKRLNFSFWGTPCVFRVTIDKKEIENIYELYDFIESIIKEREENIIKLIKDNTRFVCGACEGANCYHTQGCQFREEIINQIKQTK